MRDLYVPRAQKSVAPPREGRRRDEGEPDASDASIARDVAKIRVWPGADSPAVDAATDPRLADSGLTAKVINWLDRRIALPIAEGGRWLTRTVGPGMYWLSGAMNSYYLLKNWDDPKFSPAMKGALVAGTATTAAAAVTSTWAALPIQGALTANRFSGLFGGLAGGIFSGVNMLITLRNRQATPVEKTMAATGFATGVAGSIFGTLAAFLPVGASLGPLGLGAWGVTFGLASLGLGLGQMWLGKNKTLNRALGAIGKPFGRVWDKIADLVQ